MQITNIADYFSPFNRREAERAVNPVFKEHIDDIFAFTDLAFDMRGEVGEYELFDAVGDRRKLCKMIKEHRDAHTKDELKERVILIVHPFFPSLEDGTALYYAEPDSTPAAIKSGLRRFRYNVLGEGNYYECLDRILGKVNRDIYSLVFMEIPENYAMFSSMLLEQGRIDNVVFSKIKSGNPQDKREEELLLRGSKYLIGGCYLANCFKWAYDTLIAANKKVSVIPKLVVPAVSFK